MRLKFTHDPKYNIYARGIYKKKYYFCTNWTGCKEYSLYSTRVLRVLNRTYLLTDVRKNLNWCQHKWLRLVVLRSIRVFERKRTVAYWQINGKTVKRGLIFRYWKCNDNIVNVYLNWLLPDPGAPDNSVIRPTWTPPFKSSSMALQNVAMQSRLTS